MEDRDDYPIIPQPEKEPKKYPDFPQWLETEDGKECLAWPISETKYLQNRLFWAFDAGRNCVWHQYLEQKKELASLKEENAKLKEVVKELLQVVNLDEMEEEECNYWRPIIALAKRISDNK